MLRNGDAWFSVPVAHERNPIRRAVRIAFSKQNIDGLTQSALGSVFELSRRPWEVQGAVAAFCPYEHRATGLLKPVDDQTPVLAPFGQRQPKATSLGRTVRQSRSHT